MADASASGAPEGGARVFAKLSARTAGADCGAADSQGSPSSSGAAPQRVPVRPERVPSSCSYAASAAASTTLPPSSPGSCPVGAGAGGGTGALNPLNNIPSGLASAAPPGLRAERIVSSIPMSPPDRLPGHQQPGQEHWVYPSEQMFFNAMKRKGWDPQPDDMRSVVSIHNVVNERAWREVLVWERLHCDECPAPKLRRFQGRPSDLSPKARLLNFLGYGLPFDRHDWVVDRCGKEVRYIIDFYNGAPQPDQAAPAAFFLDVRPALDSVEAAWDRVRMQLRWIASGRWLER